MGEYILMKPFIAVAALSQIPTHEIWERRAQESLESYRSFLDLYPRVREGPARDILLDIIEREGNYILYLVNKAVSGPIQDSTLSDLLGSA